ncbi:MAG: hypothetical protein V4634_23875 [Pseudomonadota bacterium]
MHFEIPKTHIKTFKEFAGHYLMIVISIVTALGLEQWIESVHHSHLAEIASKEIQQEIRANIEALDVSFAHNASQLKAVSATQAALVEKIRAGLPAGEINTYIDEQVRKKFSLSLEWPTVRHEAWDVAVANQSVTWMDPSLLRRYSIAYATQRDGQADTKLGISSMFSGTRFVDLNTDLELGATDPRELARIMRQVRSVLASTQNNLTSIRAELQKALDTKGEQVATASTSSSVH